MKRERDTCVICGSDCVNTFMQYEMPAFMGVVEVDCDDVIIEHMKFDCCCKCSSVQIRVELPSEMTYMNNHNNGIVGKIWKGHYEQLADFLNPFVCHKHVLEISDPSAKLARKCDKFSSWTIVEPNPDSEILSEKNICVIKEFFGVDFKASQKYDVIVHSHFMEHALSPHAFLEQCNSLLNEQGVMIFSLPNLSAILQKTSIPNNILHFEHTYFFNEDVIEYLLQMNGFVVDQLVKYGEHSIFYICRKTDICTKNSSKPSFNLRVKETLESIRKSSLSAIESINVQMKDHTGEVFLFGAHVNSQYYIFNGLKRVDGVLDNSTFKQGKKLYGTGYHVYSPNVLVGKKSPVVVCSSVGPYRKEIVEQVLSLNDSAIIL